MAQGPALSGKGVYVIMTGPRNSNQPAMEIKRQLQEKINSVADLPGTLILDYSTVRNERVLYRAPRLIIYCCSLSNVGNRGHPLFFETVQSREAGGLIT